MTNVFKNQYRILLSVCVAFIFSGGTVSAIAQQQEERTTNEHLSMQMAELAADAYQFIKQLPFIGVDKGAQRIDSLIAIQSDLLMSTNTLDYQLAIALKEAVAHALIYEMYRSEVSRGGSQHEVIPKSISFSKKTFLRLWKANMPREKDLLKNGMRGEDEIVSSLKSEVLSAEGPLDGNKLKEMSKDSRLRFRKLVEEAYAHALAGGNISPDELLIQTLTLIQVLRDLDVIVELYSKQDLPLDYDALRSMVDSVLEGHSRRLDDGMKQSSMKIVSMFGRYCAQSFNDEYCMQQSMLLGPYMNDTQSLPKQIQSYLNARKNKKVKSETHTINPANKY